MRAVASIGIGVVMSCAAARPESPPAAPPAASPPALAAPPPSAAPTPAASAPSVASAPARLEAMRAHVEPKAHAEILFPFAEQRILIPKAPGYLVRTKVEGWPVAPTGRGVLVALDQNRPRRLAAKGQLELGALLDAGRELAAGPHWLALAAVDDSSAIVRGSGGSRAAFALVRFWVGEREPGRVPAPHTSLLSPSGTYNGEAAAREVPVDFLAAPDRLGKGGARVRVTGPGVALEHRLGSWAPLALKDLPSGDFSVEVELLDEQGSPDATSRSISTISVNRELGP